MASTTQKDKAIQFRSFHSGSPILVLPNAWDAASARIFEQTGFRAVATTSSGVAGALGYPDGQHISRNMLVEVTERIVRIVNCPLSVDLEAGYGNTTEEVLQTVNAILDAGAVGINIEDSTKGPQRSLVDIPSQVELLKAIRQLAVSRDIPLVINARIDVFLLAIGDPANRFEQAVQRGNAYRQAGADCLFPIGLADASTIARLVQAISGPINILASSRTPSILELARLGVTRVSFGSGIMHAALGRVRRVASELLEHGTYTSMIEGVISGKEFRSLFEGGNS